MDEEGIRNAVRKVNFRYMDSLPPKLINKVDIDFQGVKLVSPDRFSEDNFVVVDNYFYGMNSYWIKDAEVSFYFRKENPAMIIDSISVGKDFDEREVKRTLLDLTEEVADSLGCENRVYAWISGEQDVWRDAGYRPISTVGSGMYWSKD